MNIFKWFMNAVFDWQYVILFTVNQNNIVCRAYQLGSKIYAHPYSPDTKTQLLPNGKTRGQNYVIGWEPITTGASELYHSELAKPE